MARRGVGDNFRTSTSVVPRIEGFSKSKPLLQVGAEIGAQIIRTNQQAKINENFSKAQVELGNLNRQYQVDFQGDPFNKKGLEQLRTDREEIFNRNAEGISPFFKKPWQDSLRTLAAKDDAAVEAWGFAQTQRNTITSINDSIANNLSQAAIDGSNFGTSDQTIADALSNFALSKQKLMDFAQGNLGDADIAGLFKTYDDDYLKSFISGVSETSPLRALRLMESKEIRDGFVDKKQFLDMKKAVETRAIQADKIFGQQEVLNVLKDSNSLLTKSLQEQISYAELQKQFDLTDASPAVRSFFMKANGFKAPSSALSKSEKQKENLEIYEAIRIAADREDMSPKEISDLQNRIYKAMDKNVFSAEVGAGYIDQFITPLVEAKEDRLKKFQLGKWNPWEDNIGFIGLDDLLDQVLIEPEADEDLGPATQNLNNERKLKLYDFYRDALTSEANIRGIRIGDIPSQQKSEKRKIYNAAQDQAKKLFFSDEYGLNFKDGEWPDSFITRSGQKINTGLSDSKPSSQISTPSPILEFSTEVEMEAAGLDDGTPVIVNGVTGTFRK